MSIAIVVGSPINPTLQASIANDESPRRDYFELQQALGAMVINEDQPKGLVARLLWRTLGRPAAHAWIAFQRRCDYDVVHTLSEDVGLVLALLFRLTGVRRRHVMVAHYLTPPKKQYLIRLFRLSALIDRVVVYSTPQERIARTLFPSHAVTCVLHPADHDFWRPVPEPTQAMICSAGLEFRDYPTLIAAVDGLPVQLVIAAASPWSRRPNETADRHLPSNVTTVSLSPVELRSLYNRSRFVVVPLYDVDFQAGSLVMYEAMASGKAVIATRTRGQADILRDGETGLYVAPGDVAALRDAIRALLDDPERAATMGARARQIVAHDLNLGRYVARLVEIMSDLLPEHAPAESSSAASARPSARKPSI